MSFTNTVYGSNNDIVFDPATNYDLMVKLFGYYIEKETTDGNDMGYIAHFNEEENIPQNENINVNLNYNS